MSDVDRERYVLPPDESDRIFREDIVRLYLQGTEQAQPVSVIVAGQTGAGKTAVTDLVQRALDQRGAWVNINLDTYKPHHPMHAALMAADDITAGAYTSIDGHRWMDASEAYALQHRFDIVWESAMRDPRDFEDPVRRMRAARPDGLTPHRIEVAIVATPAALSRLGALTRYLQQVEDFGVGRFIDPAIHDACYDGVVRSSNAIDTERLAEHVFVVRRDATVVYSNSLGPDGAWQKPAATAAAVTAERNRPWNATETRAFQLTVQRAEAAARTLPAADRAAVLAEVTTIRSLAAPLLATAPSSTAARARSTTATRPRQLTSGAGQQPAHLRRDATAPAPGRKPHQR
ncbi:zeta toxin family protein [Kitasatospora aureofaciens]|uniref:zeta toxin family protein n=1 Tax=Kitasatospora aureofaciens TaxID=1894 RepID=UPI001C497468|nr:zeta toxin family protein [Kitasatospora aureofaciens]MBV6700221.1 zeta toxin family protein [Kitasatospora aureofaciens]